MRMVTIADCPPTSFTLVSQSLIGHRVGRYSGSIQLRRGFYSPHVFRFDAGILARAASTLHSLRIFHRPGVNDAASGTSTGGVDQCPNRKLRRESLTGLSAASKLGPGVVRAPADSNAFARSGERWAYAASRTSTNGVRKRS
jgi:hypothetical protein